MADYNRVYTAFWRETRHWSDDERSCALFLLTCAHRRSEGLYLLPTVYAADDMGWTVDRFSTALDALIARAWAMRDGDWVLLVNGLRWNPPKGEPQEKGAAKAVADVPRSSPLYAAFYAASREYAEGLFQRLDTPSIPSTGGSGMVPDGGIEGPDTPSISLAPPHPLAPPLAQAAADARGREAIEEWPEVEQALRQVPEWSDALDRGASVACLALVQASRDVPWVQIASTAAASRLDVDAGLRTDSPRQALDMQLADHRAGRSTGAAERGTPRRRGGQESEFAKSKAMTERLMQQEVTV